jgi:hypothetical protein
MNNVQLHPNAVDMLWHTAISVLSKTAETRQYILDIICQDEILLNHRFESVNDEESEEEIKKEIAKTTFDGVEFPVYWCENKLSAILLHSVTSQGNKSILFHSLNVHAPEDMQYGVINWS